LLCKAEGDGSWQKALRFATGNTGLPLVIGAAALVQAFYYAAEASNSEDKSKWWDSAGALLTGIEPFIPLILKRGIPWIAPQLAEGVFARVAAATLGRAVVAVGAAEAAAMIGAEAIATFLSGIGTVIILGLFVVRNWETISAARPKQTCSEWLEYIENSRVGKLGPSDVKTAIANAKTALGNATWASASDYLMRQELQSAGLPLEDVASFMEPADSLLQ
jgi:hypothetical protein